MKKKTSETSCFHRVLHQWNKENLLLLLKYFLLAIGVNLIVELCNRRGIPALLTYLSQKPLQFLFGSLIVYLTFLFGMLFRKRNYFISIFAFLWVALAVVSYIMLSGFVSTPLTAPDIAVLRTAKDIIQVYLGNVAVALILIGLALLFGGVLFLSMRFRSHKTAYTFTLANLALIGAIVWISSTALIDAGYLDSQFTNIPAAYQDNGFVYCFTCSALYQGIDKPSDYSPELVDDVMKQVDSVEPAAETRTPNIVFVQLESFFDVKYMRGLEFSEDPLPNFTRLKEEYSSGLFGVPSIGAGTVNTEFEVLSQMNLQDFGVGEYPYKTVARDNVCDTIAYSLKELGYSAHAIHNNNATFYQRNLVYSNLGFDTFTSLEYMNNVSLNPLGWAKDKCLTQEILDTMSTTKEKDFVFTVSVQPHGQYPSEVLDDTQKIHVTSGMEEDARLVGFEYYINQIHETDQFVGELVEKLSDFDEDVILVFYGDHLPSFNIADEDLTQGNNQTTEYVIWANFDLPVEDRDISAFQISSVVMDKLGITNSLLARYHMLYRDATVENAEYLQGLKLLDYDILYGEHYCYGGQFPWEPTQLQLGVQKITISRAVYMESTQGLTVLGENFTPYSAVMIDGTLYETEFISPKLLRVNDVSALAGKEICVAQTSKSDRFRALSQTEPWIYPEPANP